ncbi:transcriptional regulator, AraC family [Myroides odoratimimus]|uniref:AraC family transcriptional regulator n=1 Tax=Myroides odoratimimus TaxID=76832 RepID=UPI00072C5811|nr:helix-turn-helix transcriptional regulator [Myroides odoratimimus]GAQ13291.1 transcriptional regulator, AraC family [Myroides odoratimimus]STZ48541.1 Bacillibactin transport regulator [Myroides odoratimimus]
MKTKQVSLKNIAGQAHDGIFFQEVTAKSLSDIMGALKDSHRHDYHVFLFLMKGELKVEIDFTNYELSGVSLLYTSPGQVHKNIEFKEVLYYVLAIKSEYIAPEYKSSIQSMFLQTRFVQLSKENISLLKNTAQLCIDIYKKSELTFYTATLKNSVNVYISLFLDQYLNQGFSPIPSNRFEKITLSFVKELDIYFVHHKRPSYYAELLHISTTYLNECITHTLGIAVSKVIQERVILEAKRMLFYTDLSVKEIASALGYEDYSYFSRLFMKNEGCTPIVFRGKNRD